MSNDLETLRQRLRDVLFDQDDETWHAGEKDDILIQSVRRLQSRVSRPLDPTEPICRIDVVNEQYYYTLDPSVLHVWSVDRYDEDGRPYGRLQSGWEVVGDPDSGLGILHLSPKLVDSGGYMVINGAGRYVLRPRAEDQSDAIPDTYLPVVLAWAKWKALTVLVSDRARFRQWQNANQVQNISINELIQSINDANREADQEWSLIRRWQKPVIGRI